MCGSFVLLIIVIEINALSFLRFFAFEVKLVILLRFIPQGSYLVS